MIQLFLAPVSSTQLYKNYQKTVENGFNFQSFFSLKPTITYQKKTFDKRSIIRLWGIKDLKISQYKQCNIDDYIFFYHKGNIISSARILSLDKNRELSILLWGKDFDRLKNRNEYWDNIIFLHSFLKVSLNFSILIKYANYDAKASVRGFNKYRMDGLNKILKDYGTIDKFLKSN